MNDNPPFEIEKNEKPERNPHCRSGCPTQDHETYADCCQDVSLNIYKLRKSNQHS